MRLIHMVRNRAAPVHIAGFTLVEVIVVIAIVAIVVTIGWATGRNVTRDRGEVAAINSLQQTVWQGATAAAARGSIVTMRLEGRDLLLRLGSGSSGQVLRRETIPAEVSTNMPQGEVLRFTPPGKIDLASLATAQDYYMQTSSKRSEFEFSVIGEVRVR